MQVATIFKDIGCATLFSQAEELNVFVVINLHVLVLFHQFYYALYKFGGGGNNQLSLSDGQVVLMLQPPPVATTGSSLPSVTHWAYVEDRHGLQGYVPMAYLAPYT